MTALLETTVGDTFVEDKLTTARQAITKIVGGRTVTMTPEMAEEVLAVLPKTGNGSWTVQQKMRSTRSKEGYIKTVLHPAQIIGPGDKMVGEFVSLSPRAYRPNGTAGYWYVVQMASAGWIEHDMLPLPEQET